MKDIGSPEVEMNATVNKKRPIKSVVMTLILVFSAAKLIGKSMSDMFR